MRLNCELAPNSVPLGLLSFGALAEFECALTQEFDAARRAEIQEAYRVIRETANQTSIFFANRAAEETKLRDDADKAKAAGDTVGAARLLDEADKLKSTYGSGSAFRIVATAFNAAASGGNAAGGLGSLAQGAAVGMLQSLAVQQVKKLADGIKGDTATREAVRAALQAVVGCAGAAAGGSGSCSSAAMGAAASVVINALIRDETDRNPSDANGDGKLDAAALVDQQARSALVTTVVAGIAAAVGLDAPSAVVAAQIETENNKSLVIDGKTITPSKNGMELNKWVTTDIGRKALALFGGDIEALAYYFSLPENSTKTMDQAARENRENHIQDAVAAGLGTEQEIRAAVRMGGSNAVANLSKKVAAAKAANAAEYNDNITWLKANGADFDGKPGQSQAQNMAEAQSARMRLDGTVKETIANADITPEERKRIADDYASGKITGSQAMDRTFEAATGVSLEAGKFISDNKGAVMVLAAVDGVLVWIVSKTPVGDAAISIVDAGVDVKSDEINRKTQAFTDALDSAKIKADKQTRIAQARGGLTNSTGAKSGTVAIADIDIAGLPKEMAGHSGINTSGKGFIGSGSGGLPATTELANDGTPIFRKTDAEYKILDNISDGLKDNPNAKGTVNIFVELPPCNSCENVALKEFKERHPNITVEIAHNDGNRIKPIRGLPPTKTLPSKTPMPNVPKPPLPPKPKLPRG